jgi:hypothetical protein
MGTTFRERLMGLWKEFNEAGQQFPRLKLDLLWQLTGEPMTRKRWMAFLEAKGEHASSDATWDDFPDGQFLARFSGNLQGLPEFEAIAKDAYLLLCETDPMLQRKHGFYGWLRTMHDIARDCPTKAVDYEVRVWGHKDLPDEDVFAKLTNHHFNHKGMSLPAYPVQLSFRGCLFRVARDVVEMFLAPHRVGFLMDDRPVRLVPWQLCAVSANSALLGHSTTEIAASGIRQATLTVFSASDRLELPHFEEGPNDSGTLMLGDHILRHIRAGATFVCSILREFDRQDWPPFIANPHTNDLEAEHKARDFVRRMNCSQTGSRVIEFKAENCGKRIAWRVAEAIMPFSQQDEQHNG